ncbi:MAG: cytochrome c nitrite reductase small subunit [Myxococcota bacterium]|nr:cytochrome c nitrite reductase small subunit [Myxococcota bacterium]
MRSWAQTFAVLMVGIAAGAGVFTFAYANGASYLTDDPAACANCHVMGEHLASWERGSHRSAAVCNDCHAPHALVPKYSVKAWNGLHHGLAFTTGRFPDALRITALNRSVTEGACRGCHAAIVDVVDDAHGGSEEISCIRCHSQVGHLR